MRSKYPVMLIGSFIFIALTVHFNRKSKTRTLSASKPNETQILYTNVPELQLNKPYLRSTPMSKDLVVHRAYFDDRPRNGHTNSTVLFIDVNRTILHFKWIIACGVGNSVTSHLRARDLEENIMRRAWLGSERFTHEQIALECYDLAVRNGSRAFVIYKTSGNTNESIVVESERPLMIPAPRVPHTGQYNITVVTCTKAHDRNVTWLPEFVQYQKTIGVDHVFISVLNTFIEDGGLQDMMMREPSLRQAVSEGYLTFDVWTEWYHGENEVYLHSEILRKVACIYHHRGTYDYAFPLDSDDFFVPRIPGKTQLKEYILRYCYKEPYASCTFNWLYFYPGLCGMKDKVGKDGNVTEKLVSQKYDKNRHSKTKSVHLTQALVDATFHAADKKNCLMPGYKAQVVPEEVAYVAHNRMNVNKDRSKVC